MHSTQTGEPLPGTVRIKRRVVYLSVPVIALICLFLAGDFLPGIDFMWNMNLDLATGTIIALFGAALLCEYIDSSLGMGYGTTLVPLLLLAGFNPLHIVPAVLFSEFITGLAASVMHHRDGNVDFFRDAEARSAAALLSVLSVAGTLAAAGIAVTMPTFHLKLVIGLIILAAGATTLLTIRRKMRFSRRRLIGLGVLAAFNKGMSGGGYGPIVTSGQMISGLSPKKAVAVTSLAESVTCISGLCAYLAISDGFDWTLALPLTAGAVLSVPLATVTVSGLSEKRLRLAIGVATCGLGVLMLVKILM